MLDTPPSAAPTISFRATCARALLYLLVIGAMMQGVLWETGLPEQIRFSETGFTESMQTLWLTISCLLLVYARQVLGGLPRVTLLMFGLLAAALIREQDAFLDAYVFDGAWQTLVTLLLLPILYIVLRERHAFVREFEGYVESFSFGLFAAGFLGTFAFSRLYGRSEMWESLLAERYIRVFKDAAEEVTELFGYTLLLFAMIELVLWIRRRQAKQA
ncbi:hypothetical protein LCL99_13070 [Halomonas denitrificans]|uniref:hypothetical protein n=1 Tax=Halomonas TaxID=2745 RepID=UPI001C9374C7|nr:MULTISPECIES: hypothetical protein [Halomonas]MBY5929687.1 hypothetical protein [Halomonas sp. DP8Y7-3]MBY6028333.1 hypothetical protein [Halomonas sp. DP8Y7-1]MCA0975409.1 hypothetical protein [Halomonas denitrificans]MED5295463.1 hypothetical protein [Pseudomonadota bacterium]